MRCASVIDSRVRLARNYQDLPFDLSSHPEFAAICVSRSFSALKSARLVEEQGLVRLKTLSPDERAFWAESRFISRDLLKNPEVSAWALCQTDDESMLNCVSVMMNEDDHLRIQAQRTGLDLQGAATACFRVDDALSREGVFAFDEQLGYLTANPTNIGTGMRGFIRIHLPWLSRIKDDTLANIIQQASMVGVNIRGVYGQGREALGSVYQISNHVTLGRTEQEIISNLTSFAIQLDEAEAAKAEDVCRQNRLQVENEACIALGVLKHARILALDDFYRLWNQLRIGAVQQMVKIPLERVDQLLDDAQSAHLRLWAGEPRIPDEELNEYRATRLRDLLADV